METVVRYSKFISDPYGDGGARRSRQIEEFWKRDDTVFVDEKFPLPKRYSLFEALGWVLWAFRFICRHVGWEKFSSVGQKYRAVLLFGLRKSVIYDKYAGKQVIFLWENTQDYASFYLMKAAGARIIAYPHNIESLVPVFECGRDMDGKCLELADEVRMYLLCDEVRCISREETWLLQTLGVKASYFPYYPPAEAENELLRVKRCRMDRQHEVSVSRSFLLLGSATNPPTKAGMNGLLTYFDTFTDLPFDIHVVGYGTDSLVRTHSGHIVHHGPVSNDVLEKLLISAAGVVIYQPATSGALTRIVECRVAGIPVFANFGAARNYHNLPGIAVYDTFDGLYGLLTDKS